MKFKTFSELAIPDKIRLCTFVFLSIIVTGSAIFGIITTIKYGLIALGLTLSLISLCLLCITRVYTLVQIKNPTLPYNYIFLITTLGVITIILMIHSTFYLNTTIITSLFIIASVLIYLTHQVKPKPVTE